VILPNISLENSQLLNDVSQISMSPKIQEGKNLGELRTQIGRVKQGLQSADPSKKIELRTGIGFNVNKFESLKNNKMNQSIM